MIKLTVTTQSRCEMNDITLQVQEALEAERFQDGAVMIFVPHTTCGLTINENTDPDVTSDILGHFDRMIPLNHGWRHLEGNSAAHIKSSVVGCSVMIAVEQGTLQLGTWQGIFLCEFDGPRKREVWLKCL